MQRRTSLASSLTFLLLLFTAGAVTRLTTFSATENSVAPALSDSITIQQAINNASPGDTVQVPSGIHYEHLTIDRSITLVGEKGSIIDGNNSRKIMLEVTANDVIIENLEFRKSGYGWNVNGIYLNSVSDCKIENNTFANVCHDIRLNNSRQCTVNRNIINGTMYGIRVINSAACMIATNTITECVGAVHLENASGCLVKNNTIIDNPGQGIRFYTPCTDNLVINNDVRNNDYGGMIALWSDNSSLNNRIFHNNFLNNTHSFIIQCNGTIWDSGYEGNYWSDHGKTDANQDGIDDTPYTLPLGGQDLHPLEAPFRAYEFQTQETTFTAGIICAANITDFQFVQTGNNSEINFKTHISSVQSSTTVCRFAVSAGALKQPLRLSIDGNQESAFRRVDQGSNESWLIFCFPIPAGDHSIAVGDGNPPTSLNTVFVLVLLTICAIAALFVIILLRKRFHTKHQK